MNAPSKQHNKLTVEEETETVLVKVQDLCRDAYASGYQAGYHRGFEMAAKALTGQMVEGRYAGMKTS